MSNSEEQHVDAQDAHDGLTTGADLDRESGPGAQLATKTKSEAGEELPPQPSSSRPDELSIAESFALLRVCVESMLRTGSSTAAAGVAARMGKTDSRFSPRATPFGTFRRFLEAAARQGVVSLASTPGGSDLAVSLPSSATTAVPSTLPSSSAGEIPRPVQSWLRPDLWRALVSGNSDGLYAFERRTRLTRYWPEGIPTGQEADHVAVLPITTAQQISWMRDFAERERDAEIRETLTAALDAPDLPAKAFKNAIRAREGLSRRWGRQFRVFVLAAAQDWARSHGIDEADILSDARTENRLSTTSGARQAPAPDLPDRRSETGRVATPIEQILLAQDLANRGYDPASATDLRRQVLTAVATMPLSELLRLPIPAEYLLRT